MMVKTGIKAMEWGKVEILERYLGGRINGT